MPIIVNTKSGTVREITGQATIRLPGGREQALLPGMTVRAGDLILTTQNSIVEIVEDPAAPKLPPVPDAEVTRAIASIEDGRGGPGTGVIASDGTGLQPGLRVERISESIGASAFSLATASPPGSTPIEDRATTPEDGLAIDVPTTLELVAPELTNDNTPTISGRTNAPPGSVVTIEITDAEGRRQTVTAPVGPDGRYSVDVPQPLADGPYTATGSVTVPGGDSATARDDGLVDTTPPAPTITLLPIAGNDVVDATEAGGNVLVAGRAGGDARPGDTVTLTIGGQTFTTTVAADGSFSVSVPGSVLAGGSLVEASLTSVDAAGNSATVTASRPYALDAAPVAVNDAASVGEDGPAVAGDLTPGTPAQDRDPEGAAIVVVAVGAGAGAPAAGGVGSAVPGTWGELRVQADGSYAYTPGSTANALRAGETVTETFTYRIADPEGNTSTATLTITLAGAQDPAQLAGTLTGAVTEDGTLVTGGTATVADPDRGEAVFVPQTATAGTYGSFTIDAEGRWTYTLDNASPLVQALRGGQQVVELFTITSADGTTAQVRVVVNGTDDGVVVTPGRGEVIEDRAPTTGGTLTANDPDNPGLAFVPTVQTGAWGELRLGADGGWSYTLGDAAQVLRQDEVKTELFTVTLTDGSTTTITITVTGTADGPVLSTGRGAVTEDVSPTAGGTLTATDADNPALAFVPATSNGAYGSLAVAADGTWSYTLGAAAQALGGGEQRTEIFQVTLNDGSVTTVTIVVTGTDDTPVISSGTGAVTEDTAPSTSGTLTATDVDNPALAFLAATQAGAYGELVLAANGQWTYTLGPAAQALAGGQTATETFTVRLSDGSTTTVTITVTGTDDAPVISAGTGAVTEDTAPSTGGTLTATDADNPALAFVPATQGGAFGSLVLAANGQWTYTLGPAAQALAGGQTAVETFTVALTDGSTTQVTVNITGTNDAPALDLDANDSSGATGADYRGAFAAGNGPVSVVDADVALTDIDGSRYTGATVTLTNARAGDVLAVGTLPPGLSAVVNGNTVTLSGSGSAADYALALRAISFDNTLAAPDATPRVFSITVSDGISDSNTASSTITIGDANDAPLNALPASVDTFEDRLTPITGVSVSDADESGGDASFKLSTVQVTVAHGALQVTLAAGASIVAGAAGSGTLTLSGSQAAINATLATLAYLGDANFSGADTLVVTSRDGQGLVDTDSVAINVAPVNDAPSGADRTITIAEDGSHVLVRADFGFADAPGENNAFASVTVAPPTQGTLLLNGVAITGATVVTVAQLDAGVLRFVPAADANGIAYAGFDFRVTDDGGIANGGVDTDPTANRITFDVTPVNDAPTVGNANASVSEEGLFGGVADGSGTPDTTDGTTASGRVAIGDVDSATLTVTLQAPTATLTSGGVAITWSGAGTDTLVGTAGGRTVATLTIDASGQYDFRLLGPLDHPGANAEDVLALQFGVVASDSSVSTRGTLTVNVEDDAPVSAPPASVATLSMIDTNLMIVLDTSLSMNQTDGVNGTSRLASAVAAVNRLLDQYDSFGGVAVRLVTFNDVGEAVGTRWTSVADARAELQNLLTGGGTNYDSALAVARSAWTSTGKIDGAQNTLYFLSDGQPVPFARGIDATEEASWVGFLNDNQIRAFSIGLGVDAAQGPLNPVAYDGQIGENTNGILVRDFAQLDDALAATVPTLVGNPLLPGGTFDLPTSGIGADGGRVLSLTFGSTTYTFDPANGGSITVTGGPNQGVFDTTTDTLTVTTTAGGAFAVDLVNGKYSYSGPPSIGAPITETFGYVLVDGDGDTTTSSVSVSVERVTVQVGTTAADTLNGSTGQDFIIARSGNDTVSGSDNADRLAGNDGDDRLDGGAGNDALFGGSGSDTLDGGNGNDTLDGGVGGDRLTGGAGADVFAWTLADRGAPGAPPTDTTVDFAAAAPAQGGDALDLRDLLVGETSATLDRFLDFDVTAGGTTIRISSTGGFSGGGYSAAAEDQRIVLEGVDIRAVLGLASGATDATIIQTLIDRSKLLVDSNA